MIGTIPPSDSPNISDGTSTNFEAEADRSIIREARSNMSYSEYPSLTLKEQITNIHTEDGGLCYSFQTAAAMRPNIVGKPTTIRSVTEDTNELMYNHLNHERVIEMHDNDCGEAATKTTSLSNVSLTDVPKSQDIGSPAGESSSVHIHTMGNLTPGNFLTLPRDIDVIFGRGEPTRKHPGNVILREHVNKWLAMYMKASKMDKSSIIRRVIQDIDDSGARYLVPKDSSCRHSIFTSGCREAGKSEVRSKVSHAFRDGERRVLMQREKEEAMGSGLGKKDNINTPVTSSWGGKIVQTQTNRSKEASVGDTAPVRVASHSNEAIKYTHEIGSSEPGLSHLPKLIDGIKPKVETHGFTTVSCPSTNKDLGEPDDGSSVLPRTPYGNNSHVAASDPAAPSTDLLCFATILTSLRRNSSPQVKLEDTPNRLHALSSFATSSLSDISSKEKPLLKQGKISKKENLKNASPIVQSLEKYCRKSDIVFGRGAPLRQHPGNITFRKTVSKYNKRYGEASKHEKTAIIQTVISELQSTGAKFLMMDDSSGVTEASSDEIRMKVSHRFRDFTKEKSSHGRSKSNDRSKTQQSATTPTPDGVTSTKTNAEGVMIEV